MVGNHLPEDVLVEVLARLPVKSLLRFKCVSKSWRHILKEPSFITKHYLTRAISNNGSTVLTRRYWFRGLEYTLMSENAQAIQFTNLNMPFFREQVKKSDEVLEVAGPINGIVLVSNKRDLTLWNPATRKFKALPSSSQPCSYLWNPATRKCKALPSSSHPCSLPDKKFIRNYCRVGFGIDPITNGYKVVRIWSFLLDHDWSFLLDHDCDWEWMDKVEVFSLSVDSCKPSSSTWKIIDAVPPVHIIDDFPTDSVYLKGKYYWRTEANYQSKRGDGIVWFDLGDEVFGLIELSEVRSDLMDYMCFDRLVVMKDSIAMVRYTHKVDENFFYKIWIMNECDAGVSWTYYASVGPFTISDVPLGVWKGEELVVGTSGDLVIIHIPSGEVLSYDTTTHETKDTIHRIFLDDNFPLVNYNESLVSVTGED